MIFGKLTGEKTLLKRRVIYMIGFWSNLYPKLHISIIMITAAIEKNGSKYRTITTKKILMMVVCCVLNYRDPSLLLHGWKRVHYSVCW